MTRNTSSGDLPAETTGPGTPNRQPDWTIAVLSTVMALHMTGFVILLPLFARRFEELGAGVEALGISAMAYALASCLAAPFMGGLADRFGRRRVVLFSLAASALAFSGYLLASTAGMLIALRGCAGALTAGMIPAMTGLAADLAPLQRRAQWVGYLNGGASVGWIAGPVLGGFIYDNWGFHAALIVSISTVFLTFLLAFLLIPAGQSAPANLRKGEQPGRIVFLPASLKTWQVDLRRQLPGSISSFVILLFICFTVMFAWAFIEPRFMFYAYNDLGWDASMLGLMMSTYGIALLFGEFWMGGLSDRWGRKPIILVGMALFTAQFFGLALFKGYLQLALAFAIAGLGNALYDPALSAALLDISPAEQRARLLGIKSMAGALGSILGPALLAVYSTVMSARSVFLVAGGVVVLVMLTFLGIWSPRTVGGRFVSQSLEGGDVSPNPQYVMEGERER